MYTNDEIRERAAIYRQLIDFKPFQALVIEMGQDIEEIKEANVTDITSDGLYDKGIVAGIRQVINTPINAIREAEKLENSEPS